MSGASGSSSEAPRVRDLPAPRRSQSVIGPLFQRVFAWPYRLALAGLFRAGVRPWQLTTASLAMNVLIGWLIVRGDRLVPGLLLIPAGLFDIFDGGVARLRREDSRWGAFLDSVMDRLSDAVLFGALFWSLMQQNRRVEAALALAALIVSLGVSHLRAEAEAHGVRMSEGLFQRLERYVALMIGLTVPGALLPALAVLVLLGAVTAGQRLATALRRLPSPAPLRGAPQKE